MMKKPRRQIKLRYRLLTIFPQPVVWGPIRRCKSDVAVPATGDIKKGLLYWFITTVAQQCMIPRRRSSLSGLVVAFLDDPIVIPNYPYQDHEQDHPSRDRVGRQVKCSWKWKWEELQLHGNRTLRKQDPQMLTWSV